MAHGAGTASRAQFEENLLAKLATPEFTADLPEILSEDALTKFDVQRASELALTRLVVLLKGDPWQGVRSAKQLKWG